MPVSTISELTCRLVPNSSFGILVAITCPHCGKKTEIRTSLSKISSKPCTCGSAVFAVANSVEVDALLDHLYLTEQDVSLKCGERGSAVLKDRSNNIIAYIAALWVK